jgi:hypothetical protein
MSIPASFRLLAVFLGKANFIYKALPDIMEYKNITELCKIEGISSSRNRSGGL